MLSCILGDVGINFENEDGAVVPSDRKVSMKRLKVFRRCPLVFLCGVFAACGDDAPFVDGLPTDSGDKLGCEITVPANNSSSSPGKSVTFAGKVVNANSDEAIEVTFQSNLDGELAAGMLVAETFSTETSSLSEATHVITFEAKGEGDRACSASVLHSVGVPPTVTITTPTDNAVIGSEETLTFAATVSDNKDAAEDLKIVWMHPDLGVLNESAATDAGVSTFDIAAFDPGDHQVSIRVTDSEEFFAVATVSLTIDAVPGAPEVAIIPGNATTTSNLQASIVTESVDPEGETVVYRYVWTRDSVETAFTSGTISASETSRGQEWRLDVFPSDGISEGPMGSDTITIGNAPPTITSIGITPNPATDGATLMCGLTSGGR